jgi:hypothetical protein
MDPITAFKSEVFRPIASIVLPGMLAIGPFSIALANALPEISKFSAANPVLYFALLTGASTIAGMLLENIGSSIERGVDQCMETEYASGASAIWAAYLGMSCSETYGRKYLASLVTRLKFINSMIPAIYIFGAGIWVLHVQIERWSTNVLILISFCLIALGAWLFRTSIELSEAALFSRLQMLPKDHGLILDTEADSVSRLRHLAYVVTELRSSRVYDVNFKRLNGLQLFWKVLLVLVVSVPAGAKMIPAPSPNTKSGEISGDTSAIGRKAVGTPR